MSEQISVNACMFKGNYTRLHEKTTLSATTGIFKGIYTENGRLAT